MASFRETFHLPGGRELLHWFPFHMKHGLKSMQSKLRNVDAVIEVHDARVPFSGRSTLLNQTMRARPYLLVLNKADLADMTHQDDIVDKLSQQGAKHVMFASCNRPTSRGVREIVPRLLDIINSGERFNRAEADLYRVMVIGVPNTGKSTLINSLRRLHLDKAAALPVSDTPGVTRHVMNRVRICDVPPTYLLDTPGIWEPRASSVDAGMRLALCNILRTHELGAYPLADYILYILNRYRYLQYVETLGLVGPCDDIDEVLHAVAAINGWTTTYREQGTSGGQVTALDTDRSAQYMVNCYRAGRLGRVCLDLDKIDTYYRATGRSEVEVQQ